MIKISYVQGGHSAIHTNMPALQGLSLLVPTTLNNVFWYYCGDSESTLGNRLHFENILFNSLLLGCSGKYRNKYWNLISWERMGRNSLASSFTEGRNSINTEPTNKMLEELSGSDSWVDRLHLGLGPLIVSCRRVLTRNVICPFPSTAAACSADFLKQFIFLLLLNHSSIYILLCLNIKVRGPGLMLHHD